MKAKRFLSLYAFLVYAFIYFPLMVVVLFSFNDARRNVVWKGFTLKWYGSLVANTELISALWVSLKLGVISSVLAVLLGTLASYALVRHPSFRGKRAYQSFLNIPLMLPEIVLGVGLLSFFVWVNFPLGFWSLVLAHVVFCVPYVMGSVSARLSSLTDDSLEDAAMDLGATELEAFWKVTLPLAWPAILSGALLAFTMSFEDFVTSFFVSGVGNVTLPIKIYSMMKFGITPEVNALSTLLLVLLLTALLARHFLSIKEPVS
ncbi:MAG: ABC transporter permease [Elusimicrobia bacterium]|nr:ABC transporter permease [Elusimicrobiota bacterium]